MSVTPREELSAGEERDLAALATQGAGSIAFNLLVLAALALVLGLSIHFRKTWDFTARSANSLSQQSADALASLTRDVSVYGLFKDADKRRDAYWDLLQLYRRSSDKVRVEIFDPNARPGQFAALGLAAEDRNAVKDGISVAIAGERKVMFRGVAEEDVTNAILEAGSDAPRVVGFLRGYGEHDPASTADAGMSRAREALTAEYYDVVDVRLDAAIPDRVTLLIAAGLEGSIPQADLDRLIAWLEGGGRLLVLVEPGHEEGLAPAAGRWGLRAKPVRVLDRKSNLRGQPEIPVAARYSKHAIVRGFSAALPLALPLPVAVEDFEPGDPAVFHETLVSSSADSEGVAGDGARTQGPFALAAASWKSVTPASGAPTETRIVLVGDALFATNGFLAESANRSFFLNCVGWLSRSRGMVTLRQDPLKGQMLSLKPADQRLLQVLVLAPLVVVLAVGVVVWTRRRGL
jgi:hypothetical protein